MSYVYIAPLKDKSAFKVGTTATPDERIRQLSRYYKFNIKEVSIMNYDGYITKSNVESLLLSVLSDHRVPKPFEGGSEFFNYQQYQNALDLLDSISAILGTVVCSLIVDFDIDPMESPISLSLSAMGKRCAARRLNMNITQLELAKASGVGLRTVQRLENGESSNTKNLMKIMSKLRMTCEIEPAPARRERASHRPEHRAQAMTPDY